MVRTALLLFIRLSYCNVLKGATEATQNLQCKSFMQSTNSTHSTVSIQFFTSKYICNFKCGIIISLQLQKHTIVIKVYRRPEAHALFCQKLYRKVQLVCLKQLSYILSTIYPNETTTPTQYYQNTQLRLTWQPPINSVPFVFFMQKQRYTPELQHISNLRAHTVYDH